MSYNHMDPKLIAKRFSEIARLCRGMTLTNPEMLKVSYQFQQLAYLFDPDVKGAYDSTCNECLNSRFIGGQPCSTHAPFDSESPE